jgi:hypothetical protein
MASYVPVYFDTEFILTVEGLIPLSLAFTTLAGDELYLVIEPNKRHMADEFVQSFVLPYIDNEVPGATNVRCWQWNAQGHIMAWLDKVAPLRRVEFWADFAAHDWIALTHLMGGGKAGFDNLPKNLPHFCHDIEVIARWKGYSNRDLPKYVPEDKDFPAHHAMTDARDVKLKHQFLVNA